MADRSDHAALAASAIGTAFTQTGFEEATSITHAAIANARATLAVAEQLRIANLIAVAQMEGGPYKTANRWERDGEDANVAIEREIREGLGL